MHEFIYEYIESLEKPITGAFDKNSSHGKVTIVLQNSYVANNVAIVIHDRSRFLELFDSDNATMTIGKHNLIFGKRHFNANKHLFDKPLVFENTIMKNVVFLVQSVVVGCDEPIYIPTVYRNCIMKDGETLSPPICTYENCIFEG